MDYSTYIFESLKLKDHPGNLKPRSDAEREEFYVEVGKFLDQLAQMRSGMPSREDAEEIDSLMLLLRKETDPEILQPIWAAVSGNAKIVIALRHILALYKITFPPDHDAIKAGWEKCSELKYLIISTNPLEFKTRAELTA